MSKIKILTEDALLTNTPSSETSLEDIFTHVTQHIDLWHDMNIIWDMRQFDFTKTSTEEMRKFIERAQKMAAKRKDHRTAIVVGDALGFEMMSMFSELGTEHLGFSLRAFENMDDARAWILPAQ